MNILDDSAINDLIGKANSAIKDGDTTHAREYAMQAVNLDPQSEQAWLILASLSEPEQALLFIENALRANPHSQAARKAIRLVYRQMAAKEKSAHSEVPAEPHADSVSVPAIPIEAEITGEEPESWPAAETPESIDTSSTSNPKKELLLKNLRKKGVPTEQPSSIPAPKVKLIKKSAPHARLQLVRTNSSSNSDSEAGRTFAADNEISIETPESPSVNVVESGNGISVKEPSIEKQAIPAEPQTPKLVDRKSRAAKIRKPASRPAPAQPKASSTKKPAKEKSSLPFQVPAQESKPAKHTRKPRIHQEPINVDTIELILISIATILIPLLVFLYFYLTR